MPLRDERHADADDRSSVEPLAADEAVRLVADLNEDAGAFRTAADRNPHRCRTEAAGGEHPKIWRRIE